MLLRHVDVVCGYTVTGMWVLLRASANAGLLLLLSLRVVLGITYHVLLLVCIGIRARVLRSNRFVTYLGLLRVGVACVGVLPCGRLLADLALLRVVRVGPQLLLVTRAVMLPLSWRTADLLFPPGVGMLVNGRLVAESCSGATPRLELRLDLRDLPLHVGMVDDHVRDEVTGPAVLSWPVNALHDVVEAAFPVRHLLFAVLRLELDGVTGEAEPARLWLALREVVAALEGWVGELEVAVPLQELNDLTQLDVMVDLLVMQWLGGNAFSDLPPLLKALSRPLTDVVWSVGQEV